MSFTPRVRTASRSIAMATGLPVALVFAAPLAAQPVHVNQHGYTPADAKWVATTEPATTFEIRRQADQSVAYSGALSLRRAADPASGDDVYSGDFSDLDTPGSYFVRVPGASDSPQFAIAHDAYDLLYRALVKGLYYERCGTAIPVEYGGDWTHPVCHDHGASIASYDWTSTGGTPSGYLDTIGGWHDAGDYGKYSVNNAYTIGVLLQAYERYPDRYAHDDCAIPESGNGVPDLLDETRWSLEWMLKMQLSDGSVMHRESIATFDGCHLPDEDPLARYYTDISSDATAVHCAAMALAARVYEDVDAVFAAQCEASAVAAWAWLQAHPDRVPAGGFVNLYGHDQATYVFGSEVGRRLWAAAEVFRLTGDAAAQTYIDTHWGETAEFNGVWYPDGWGAAANLGAFTYRDTPGATPGVVSGNWWSIETSTLASSANWAARVADDGYGCVAASAPPFGDYYWGFTGVILRYAWTLLEAYRYGGDPAFEEAAKEQLHYIVGRNPMGKVYVTGIGEHPVLHAHGAWNFAAGYTAVDDSLCHPVPYCLVGGPNKADNDAISPYPGKCYEDIADPNYFFKGNYTLNETSINIQASLIVLAGYFSTGGTATSVGEASTPVSEARLNAAPNPFRSATAITWRSSRLPGAPGAWAVYDATGRRVAGLTAVVGGDWQAAVWDGALANGRSAPAGTYFVRLPEAGPSVRIVKLD